MGAAVVTELVEGATLRVLLDEHGGTEPEPALSVLEGSLLGLGAAHERGDATVVELPGQGHAALQVAPDLVADVLVGQLCPQAGRTSNATG